MRTLFIIIFSVFGISLLSCNAQNKTSCLLESNNPEYDKQIKRYLTCSVPTISVHELNSNYSNYVILDARELEEYNISHLPSALFLGYKNPDWSVLDSLDKESNVLVYCSIGYRSEKMAEKIHAKGHNVYNLYGSIFEWINNDLPIHNTKGKISNQIHGYNKSWSKWVLNNDYEVSY